MCLLLPYNAAACLASSRLTTCPPCCAAKASAACFVANGRIGKDAIFRGPDLTGEAGGGHRLSGERISTAYRRCAYGCDSELLVIVPPHLLVRLFQIGIIGPGIHVHLLNNLHFLEDRNAILQGLKPPRFHSRVQGEKPAGAKVEIHDFLIDTGPFLHGFGRLLWILRHPLPSLNDRF